MVINPTFGQTLGQTVESNYASSGGFCLQTTKQASNGLLVENKLWHYGILLLSTNGLFPRASLISTHKDLKACAHFPLFFGAQKNHNIPHRHGPAAVAGPGGHVDSGGGGCLHIGAAPQFAAEDCVASDWNIKKLGIFTRKRLDFTIKNRISQKFMVLWGTWRSAPRDGMKIFLEVTPFCRIQIHINNTLW